jgi:hypothetical protein
MVDPHIAVAFLPYFTVLLPLSLCLGLFLHLLFRIAWVPGSFFDFSPLSHWVSGNDQTPAREVGSFPAHMVIHPVDELNYLLMTLAYRTRLLFDPG